MKTILRYIPRKCRRLFTICMVTTITTCMFITIGSEVRINWDFGSGSIFAKVKDPFGSRNMRYCAVKAHSAGSQSVLAEVSNLQGSDVIDQALCYAGEGGNADIQMENVWDTVSVGYPSFVLTVSGWVDTIKVEGWTVKPLKVIIMPHSHQDPGWLRTVDSYFSGSTRPTLNLIVEKLTENPSWTFIWTEVGLLQKWWTDATSTKKAKFKRLAEKGQLELVSGGWVMTDESVAHYGAMLDQLIEGHMWIKNNINVSVENSWAIDPFGHSSTMAYLLKQSGIRNMVVQRTHFAIKRLFAEQKNFEFLWRQTWDDKGVSDIFCHMMPSMLYGIPFSCGPDRHVCCKFDFNSKQCFHGKTRVDIVKVTDDNVADLAQELWQQLQKKSELFRSNVLLVPHGDDFRYKTSEEWENQFGNLQKIMTYINNHPEMKMKIEFGTLKDFFSQSSGRPSRPDGPYPVLSGDLFPYSDRADQYWSGFYTSRPNFKYLVRQLQQLLRSAELLFTIAVSHLNINTNMTNLYDKLETCRRTLALSQHHDAITGTSRRDVMKDYSERVQSALNDTLEVQRRALSTILGKRTNRNILVNLTESFQSPSLLASKVVCKLETPVNLIVWNDIGQSRHDLIHVLVDTPDVKVTDKSTRAIKHQISPAWDKFRHVQSGYYLLSIEVNVDAFSLSTFTISSVSTSAQSNFAAILNATDKHGRSSQHRQGHFWVRQISETHLSVSNSYLTAVFKVCDGMLYSIFYKELNSTFKADTHFVTYSTGRRTHPFQDKSGAYTFLPDGAAKDLVEKPQVIVVEGSLFTEVRAIYRDFTHISRIYNISGILAETVHIENNVNISTVNWDNVELVLRVETSIANDDLFYTDSNGYQIHRRRTRSKMTIQGNFYPMTSVAILEDDNSRFTILSSQSQGVVSLVSGWLEVVLDRRLVQDDWRGLNEGVTDNVLSKSTFYLLFEKKLSRKQVQKRTNTYIGLQTLRSNDLTNGLNSPLKVYSFASSDTSFKNDIGIHLAPSFPCGWHLVNLKMLDVRNQVKEALITFHRVGLACSYSHYEVSCSRKELLRWSDMVLGLQKITETSLTGIKDMRYQITNTIHVEPMQIKTFKIAFR